MGLLHFDGFDMGLLDPSYVNSLPGQIVTSNATSPFGVGRVLQVNGGYLAKNVGATQEIWMGCYLYCYGAGPNATALFQFWGDGGTTCHLSIATTVSTIYARVGTAGATLGTAGGWTFPTNFWTHVQAYVKIADTGGRVTIKVNDITVYDFTGDTKNGGTLASVDQVRFSREDNAAAFYYDDYWLTDASGAAPLNTFLGAARCRVLSPSGAGSSTAFTPSSGANYTCVDETPYSATDYVTAVGAVSGTRDMYAIADMATSGLVPLAVKATAVAKKAGVDPVSLKPAIRSGGTNYFGSAVALGTADQFANAIWTTDPATSAAWTTAGVNALEAGFEVA